MGLLDEFKPSKQRELSCGCNMEESIICTCGATAGHGGIEIGDNTHKTTCINHKDARLI
jgi:hypothetical protein